MKDLYLGVFILSLSSTSYACCGLPGIDLGWFGDLLIGGMILFSVGLLISAFYVIYLLVMHTIKNSASYNKIAKVLIINTLIAFLICTPKIILYFNGYTLYIEELFFILYIIISLIFMLSFSQLIFLLFCLKTQKSFNFFKPIILLLGIIFILEILLILPRLYFDYSNYQFNNRIILLYSTTVTTFIILFLLNKLKNKVTAEIPSSFL